MTLPPHSHDDDAASPADAGRAADTQILQAHLAGMLTLTPHAVIGTDPQQRITLVTPLAEELFGYPRQELLGQPLAVLLPQLCDDDALAGRPVVGPHMTTGVRRGGGTFDAMAEIARVEVPGGAVWTIQVREAPPSDEPLAASTLLHIVQDAVIITDPALRITGWNPAAEALYGWSAAEALGQPAHALLQTDYLGQERLQLLQELQARGSWSGELVHRHRDGRAIAIRATTTWMRGPDGAPLGAISVNRDISERKQVEQALRESEQNLTSVLASIDARIWSVDRAGRLIVANAIFHRDIRAILERDVLPGESLWDLSLPPEWQATWRANYDQALAGETFSVERQFAGITMVYRFTPIRARDGSVTGVTVLGQDLSTHRSTEVALQETERKLGALFELLPVGVSILDAERTVAYANPALSQILRLDQAGLAQGAYQQRRYLHSDGTPLEAHEFASVRAFHEHQPVTNVETGIVTESGEVIWTSVSAAPVDFPDWRIVVVTTDITARIQAEAALRKSVATLQAALESMTDAVFISDVEGRFIDFNAAFATFHRFPSKDACATTLAEYPAFLEVYLETGELAPLEQWAVPRALRGETITGAEYTLRRKDTGETWIGSYSFAPIRDADGTTIGSVVVGRDITERKQAEQALAAATARLRVLSEASRAFAEAGLAYQPLLDLVAQRVVEALCDFCIIRMRSDDGHWLPIVAMYHHDASDHDAATYIRTLVERAPLRVDEPNVDQQIFHTGTPLLVPVVDLAQLKAHSKPEYAAGISRFTPHSMIIVPLRSEGQSTGILGMYRSRPRWPAFGDDDLRLAQDLADRAATAIANARLYQQAQHDLAERQRAEQALETERALLARRVAERTADLSLANAELARAARLKDEFLASMSHELRTPLTGILGRAEALEEAIYGPVTAEQVTALHSIAESGQHLLTLINDILDLSKIESGRLTLERATLDVDLLGTMSIRMVAQIAQVKRIALSSRFDGQVHLIEADERRLKQILVNLLSNAVKFTPAGGQVGLEVQGNPEQQTVTFTVWDTGIGIAPFVQLDSSLNRQYSGTGLGLSLVARLAQAHGGSVAVESAPGQGSRFSVTLPWNPVVLAATPVPAAAVVDTTRPAVRQALVVEDSPTAAAQITRYLQELGAQVAIQPHATGTVERAIALQPDVIILDILLPDDDGWAVLRQLKAEPRTRDIPVLVISVVDEPERAQALGAAAMLVKPIDRPTLEQALRQILVHPTAPPVPTALVVAPYLGRPRILLADDNEETLETLGDYLRAKGYDLRVARNGREAILQAQEELPDVILMDIQMPGMDGLEAIQRIRAEATLAHVPILAVTALAMPGDRERCLAAGADAYLPKPLNLRTLATAIEAHRQRRAEPAPGDQTALPGF